MRSNISSVLGVLFVSASFLGLMSLTRADSTSQSSSLNNMAYLVYTRSGSAAPSHAYSNRIRRETSEADPEIKELTVRSDIVSRFGTVVIDSVVQNPSPEDKEVTFEVLLPEEAFMSNFTMLIEGELYNTEVVSKDEAKERYKEAQEKNLTAGLVESDDWKPVKRVRGMERFTVSINVGGSGSVTFTLTYLELLKRRVGLYEQRISIRPNQIVERLSISMQLFEQQGITDWQVIEPYDSNSLEILDTKVYEREEENMLEINFTPSVLRQKEMSTKEEVGLHGDFVLRYDVDHDDAAGLTQVANGFFVHYFSPSQYTVVLPKNVIFVIDISGSMTGEKIMKVKETMPVILEQLKEDDRFMLYLFETELHHWPESAQLVPANHKNIEAAKGYIQENVNARGGTNINDALVTAAGVFESGSLGANMIVFLTDGDPTSGVTDTNEIQSNVLQATGGMVSLFSLGYGFNMNFEFLHALSYRNNGVAHRIYDDIDADVQLRSFFDEIGSPVLYNVKLHFPSNMISSITQTTFPQFFAGSEIVIAGQLKEIPKEWNLTISALSLSPIMISKHIVTDETIQMPPAVCTIFQPTFIERLYTYLKIKDQLRLALMTDDEEERKQLRDMALRMSLDYHLVTPLTSFLIVQNERDERFEDATLMMMAPKTVSLGKSFSGSACCHGCSSWCVCLHLALILYLAAVSTK